MRDRPSAWTPASCTPRVAAERTVGQKDGRTEETDRGKRTVGQKQTDRDERTDGWTEKDRQTQRQMQTQTHIQQRKFVHPSVRSFVRSSIDPSIHPLNQPASLFQIVPHSCHLTVNPPTTCPTTTHLLSIGSIAGMVMGWSLPGGHACWIMPRDCRRADEEVRIEEHEAKADGVEQDKYQS